MSLIRKFARPALATSFIVSGVERLRTPDANEHLSSLINVAAKAYPAAGALKGNERLIGQALAGTQIAAAGLFALGKAPRLASSVLLTSGAVNAYVDYKAAQAKTQEEKAARRRSALTSASLLGAVAIASVDRDGNPSLAWRASQLSDKVAQKTSDLTDDVKSKAEEVIAKTEDLLS